jgi:phosphatidylinositol dimannoside acyltransferase
VLGPGTTEAEVRALGRAAMRSYLRYWMEAFRLPTWSQERVVNTFHLEQAEVMRETLATGRGVLLVLPHSGNWDHAGAWVCQTTAPITSVAERLKPESLYERFLAYRRSLGMEILPLGSPSVAGVLAQRLRAGGVVCLLGDRDLTASGVAVRFFGHPASMPAGPASLALHTGAALMPVSLWYRADGLRGRIHPEILPPAEGSREEKVAAMTQAVADAFAEGIAEHPADWHMLQRLWRGEPEPDRVPAAPMGHG